MKDIKKIQEFFSKSLEENTFKVGDKVTYLGHPAQITAVKDQYGKTYLSVSYDKGTGKTKASDILSTDGTIKPLKEGTFTDGEIAIYMGNDDSGLTQIWKRGNGYYGRNDSFDFEAKDKAELEAKLKRWGYELQAGSLEEMDINDPVMMKLRADKAKLAKMRAANAGDDGNDAIFRKARANVKKLEALKQKRAQIMRDMDQEAEPEGGPIADKYGSMLNKIDKAIDLLSPQEKGDEYMSKDEIERRAAMISDPYADYTSKTNAMFGLEENEDPIDTITMDVPLFIRVLEYAREDAQADMDLHDLAEKAIAATKQQGLLQMDDYDMLVGEKESVDEAELTEAYVPQNIKEFAKRKGVSRLVNTVAGWAEKLGRRITGGTAIGKNYNTLILDMGYQTADIRIDCEGEAVELYDEPVYSFADFKRVFMEEETRKQIEHDEETLRREQGLEEKSLNEKMLVPTDKIDRMARDIAAKYFSSKTDKKDAIEILKQAIKDSYKAIDPEVEIREEEGYSKFLKDDPEHPGGKTKGLTPDVMNKILMKIVQDIEESRPGLWDNIRAKRERGETPSRKGSKAYKSAVKAGKEINKAKD